MRLHIVLVTTAVLFLAIVFQGSRGLWEPDEGRYTAVALEMLRTGDWLHPQLNDWTPHYTKPPLTYWALASSFALFGHHEWAARLPGALAFAGTSLLMWPLARRLCGNEARAAIAPLLYASTAGPFIASNVVSTDGLLTFFEALAMAGFVAAWFDDPTSGHRRGWLAAMWVGFGLAFLTKGPPGLLPLAAVVGFALWRGGRRRTLSLFWLPGLALFAVVAFGWFATICYERPEMLGYFVGSEVIDRVASDSHDRHAAWYYAFTIYGPAMLGGSLPWLPAALVDRLRRRRSGEPLELRPTSDAGRLLALWVCVPLAVFVVAQSRMYLYVLPLMVPLTLAAIRLWPHDPLSLRREQQFALGWVAGLIALRLTLALVPAKQDSSRLAAELPPLPSTSDVIVSVDSRWRYGLALSTGRQVLLASRDLEPEDDRSVGDALAEVHASGGQPTLLVRRKWQDVALAGVDSAGAEADLVGSCGDADLYSVRFSR